MRLPFLLLALLAGHLAAHAAEEPEKVTARDGFVLEAKIAWPDGTKPHDIRRVVVLVHGSGPQSMDEDLTAITKDQARNLVFKDLSDSLVGRGFAVVRYHKRSYQSLLALRADPKFQETATFKAYAANPLRFFVEDVEDVLALAGRRFPKATLHLLGHSEGAYVALQVAHRQRSVKGVGLIGFAASPLECLVLEQTVYRPLALFEDLDGNRDAVLDARELAAASPIASSLRAQLPVIDLDADGRLSRLEFQAGNFSNLLMRPLIDAAWSRQEALFPRVAEILKSASFEVCFFQGLWDNQTPAYNAKAVELLNQTLWKKPNLRFRYFERHGHALDPRDRLDDLVFRPMSAEAREAIASTLQARFEPIE